MTAVVMCHGIGYQFKHHDTVMADWYESLRSGMKSRALKPPPPEEVALVNYGTSFRSRAKSASVDDEIADIPPFRLNDLETEFELELLNAFADAVEDDEQGAKWGVQSALLKLENSKSLNRPVSKVILGMIKQVKRYLDPNDTVREDAQMLFRRVVTPDTKVIIGHSLGSIVSYEALCANPDWNVDTLITLGSPLGLRAVRDRLVPSVSTEGRMRWPGVSRWLNVTAKEDPIALVKELQPLVEPDREGLCDKLVKNVPWHGNFLMGGHSVLNYLTLREVSEAVAAVLADSRS